MGDYSDNAVLDLELKDFVEGCEGVKTYWWQRMPMICAEECAELIQAISKFERHMTPETTQGLIDEMGDVYICLEALRQHYQIPLPRIKERIFKKLGTKYDENGEKVK